jgi:UTP--glucose-1-phosphate uridylyltransferase
MPSLAEQIAAIPVDVAERLDRFAFDRKRLVRLGELLRQGTDDTGVVTGRLEPPAASDIAALPQPGSAEWLRLEAIGREELAHGRLALVVLAGGMATRMGGVVKALVEALPGRTFLDLRLAEIEAVGQREGKTPPLWLMTSAATDDKIRQALGSRLQGDRIAAFPQELSLRLTPKGDLYLDEEGLPSEHAPGHGDLPDALEKSGLVERFVAQGGKTLLVTNLDNLGGTIDPVILGFHVDHGKPVTSEVVDKLGDDKGGIPARLDGKLRALEEFRLPKTFDAANVRVFNTNVFHIDARALLELEMEWSFYTVKKKIDDTEVVQFERIVNEITGELETVFLRLPRTGPSARFLPVKDFDELERRRAEIEAVAQARGLL